MELWTLNKNLEKVMFIDTFTSLIWVKRYFTTGEFELYVGASTKNVENLQKNYFLMREDDEMLVVIEGIQLDTDVENGNYMNIKGRSAESLLSRRIVWKQTTLNGTVEEGIRQLVSENAINPTDPKRKIPNLVLGELKGFTEQIQMQITGENLLTVIEEICQTYGYGFSITLNKSNQLEFNLYKGVDRSYNQSLVPFVVFSPQFDNLISTEYSYDGSKYCNVALVGGEGEGAQRRFQEVGNAIGLDRFELFVDARDVSSNDGEIQETDYNNLLIERGNSKLSEHVITESFTGEVETTLTYIYKKDYWLGDIVSIENEYGMQAVSRIIEMIESQDANGYRSIPTFGVWEMEG